MNYLPVWIGNDSAVDLRQDSPGKQIADRLRQVRSQRIERRALCRVQACEVIAGDFLYFDGW